MRSADETRERIAQWHDQHTQTYEGSEWHKAAANRIRPMTPEKAIEFLEEAARYFENRPTGGEDSTHWSNVINAENCRKIAELLRPREQEV